MDPGWPANPSNTLICILCKSAMPYNNNNPERFFRHLLADHCTYFNLNLLLEISLMQPHAVREESQSVAGGVQRVAESVLDQVKVHPIKKERKASSSSLVEPDSTSNQEISPHLLANTSGDNIQGSFNLEETSSPAEPSGSSSTNPTPIQAVHSMEPRQTVQPDPPRYHNLQPPVKSQPKPGPSSNLMNPEDISDFDLSFFINQITQPDSEQPQPPPQLPTASTFIPFESKPSPFLLQSRDPYLHDTKPYTPNMYTMTLPPDFSAFDPISFVKQEPKSKRKVTREAAVNKNNQPVPWLPDNPNRHLVPEDLQMLIIYQNPTRGIKFTFSQRMNTQMVVDDYVLKKKKGPYLTRGGRVVNWKCTNEQCHYTAVTWEGQIQDTARQHNHPRQPELYVKKQARVKIRENMVQDESHVADAVMDVVTETNPEMRNMIGSIDALKQAARRYNRKIQKESQQVYPHNTHNLLLDSEDMFVPASVYQNYEVVGEFPADYQFSVEVSDQVGHYTEVSSENVETLTEEQVPAVVLCKSEQVTVEEETAPEVGLSTSEQVLDAIDERGDESLRHPETVKETLMYPGTVNESLMYPETVNESLIYREQVNVCDKVSESKIHSEIVNESENYPRDDVEELLEPSPTKQDPLQDEFI
eukprot:GFUD01038286.1.p1 GENE.GFUD01038286.1~~GFUD01038286.1.p1  ORF type:complete len:644 (-),score=182.85 GFUD01038286.1:142-2073(-)